MLLFYNILIFYFNYNIFSREEGKITIERTLPHTITDWVGYTTCISPTHGLGIAPPTTITAFQSFFLDYNLPYSIKRGEIMRFKVSLFNYMHHSLPVSIENMILSIKIYFSRKKIFILGDKQI